MGKLKEDISLKETKKEQAEEGREKPGEKWIISTKGREPKEGDHGQWVKFCC